MEFCGDLSVGEPFCDGEQDVAPAISIIKSVPTRFTAAVAVAWPAWRSVFVRASWTIRYAASSTSAGSRRRLIRGGRHSWKGCALCRSRRQREPADCVGAAPPRGCSHRSQ
jgi:hypothetical protein